MRHGFPGCLAARAQLEAEGPKAGPRVSEGGGDGDGETPETGGDGRDGGYVKPTPPAPKPRRFYGSVEIDPDRSNRDMGQVVDEVLQHLTTLPGGKVTVTVEIQARMPEGVPDDVRRVIDENCRTLDFESHGFEES